MSLSEEYESQSLEDSLKLKQLKHASHCLLYTTDDDIHYALLQFRFDGLIGFPGGEVDVEDVTAEAVVEATTRELYEEINYQLDSVLKSDWICSHTKKNDRFVQHFFAKQLSVEEFRHLEKTHMNAEHFPSESLGVFRVPIGQIGKQTSLISRQFLSNFLSQKFAGNAKQQLLETVLKLSLLSSDDEKWIQTQTFDVKHHLADQKRAQTLFHTEFKIQYHEELVKAVYGLMIIRNDGLFDFIGTDIIDNINEDQIIRIINDTLDKEFGSELIRIDSNKAIKSVVDDVNGLSYLYEMEITNSQFTQIETIFTNTQNYLKNSFGIFRIPLVFYGKSQKACDYFNRFFRGFSNQSFAYNSKIHLISICDKFKQNFKVL